MDGRLHKVTTAKRFPGTGAIERESRRGIVATREEYVYGEGTLAELARRGVKIVFGPVEYEPIRRRGAFFADPWGNLIELIQDA